MHVPRGSRSAIERFHEPPAVDVRPANGGAVAYITKQHKRLPPDYYARTGLPWREKGHVPGPRFTFTGAARALLDDEPEIEAMVAAPPMAAPSPPPPIEAHQLDLFADLPERPRFDPIVVARAVRSGRERHGITQAALADRLGIKRPHVANVERMHDRLSPVRAKAALHLLDTGRIAA